MFSLSYSASYDPYHTIFRILAIFKKLDNDSISYQKLRMIDFYLCFPWSVESIKGVRSISGFVKSQNSLVKKYKRNSYEVIPTPKTIFERMEPIQLASYSALISYGLISTDRSSFKLAKRTEKQIHEDLNKRLDDFVTNRMDLFDFLTSSLVKVDFTGPDGLKARTGLGEYRYDDV